MPFTATTVNSAAAWRPDLYEFAPADALPEALILQCTTQASLPLCFHITNNLSIGNPQAASDKGSLVAM